ncbi:Cof-type HAD-IIB family hydrolase [Brotaphodocola sp.]|uniref:Cof-type HAD-IIB family hydrolase n=1 Tax=Brotaphodocola sp. TaxID=3073577 RepID=UPI003D7CD768
MNEKREYDLIAFDMDGTLLNSEKQISERTLKAIDRAVEAGKIVILNTGRGPAELKEYLPILPKVRYINGLSGGLVYDRTDNRKVYEREFSPETVRKILEIGTQEDAMIHFLTDRSIVQMDQWARMDHYGMGQYQAMFARVAERWENICEQYFADPFPIDKLNLYHATAEGRARTEKRLRDAGIELEMAEAETTSLELSPVGANKGSGLRALCEFLNLPVERTIAVGDADNDRQALEIAGLAVAMGNATPEIKALCDVVVADCDHDGCVEAIEKYLLGENLNP